MKRFQYLLRAVCATVIHANHLEGAVHTVENGHQAQEQQLQPRLLVMNGYHDAQKGLVHIMPAGRCHHSVRLEWCR